jgi:hypothetical protein
MVLMTTAWTTAVTFSLISLGATALRLNSWTWSSLYLQLCDYTWSKISNDYIWRNPLVTPWLLSGIFESCSLASHWHLHCHCLSFLSWWPSIR